MNRANRNHVNGILMVDKPADWTSFDVVNCIRRRFFLDKTGHCGTLDPFATGLLVVLLGKATRFQDPLMAQDKIYSGTMKLGIRTDSQDLTGEVISETALPLDMTPESLQAAADAFLGDIDQVPPMHSAIKIGGKPLYELARKGKSVERKSRRITITRFELSNFRFPEVDFLVQCSKGTYIRTLASDLGDKIGCGAHLTALRRLRSGDHDVSQAYSLDEIKRWELPQLIEHVEGTMPENLPAVTPSEPQC